MAIRRSRGVRSFTTFPPIRISPAVGVSRPAIMRRRVVFPEPEGPRKTRNSPSRVSRLTSLTAPSSPSLNILVRCRVSTTAIQSPSCCFDRALPIPPGRSLFPSGEDALVLVLGGFRGILGRRIAARDGGEHGGD